MTLDEFRKVIREELKSQISDEMRDLIRDEMKSIIREEVGSRLDALEREINVISDLQRTLGGVEKSLDFTSRRIDDMYATTFPAITRHIESIATGLAMQTLDLDVHRRKWGLTIQGLKGPSEEKESDTREACVRLLGMPPSVNQGQCRHNIAIKRPTTKKSMAWQCKKFEKSPR